MSSEVYLYFDRQRPAGVVRDWGELCQWVRRHGPLGKALQTLIDKEQEVPSAELERDLIVCFLKASEWPDEAEQLLEAVLGRLFDNPTFGMDYDPPEGEEEEFFEAPPLIVRLANHVEQGEEAWQPVKERAVLLAEIAGMLLTPRSERDTEPDDDGISELDRHDSELVAALALLRET